MAEKKVSYQVDGRQFEGMIVYDDGHDGQTPGRLHAAGLERRIRRDHRTGAHRRRQGLCRADGRHVRVGLWRKAEDAGRIARRHACHAQRSAVHARLRGQGL